MQLIFFGLAGIAGLGCFACWIITLIKMFKNESTGLAVLAIFCGLWAFIWGWMNVQKHDHKKIMMIWSALFGIYMLFYVIGMFTNPGA